MKLAVEVPDELLAAVAPPPELISQRNCGHLGLDAADFLRMLPEAEAAGVQVAKRGKLRLVRRDPFMHWLLSSSRRPAAGAPANDAALDKELEALTNCTPVRPTRRNG